MLKFWCQFSGMHSCIWTCLVKTLWFKSNAFVGFRKVTQDTVVLWSAEQPRSEIHVSGNNYLGIWQYSKWGIPASRDALHKLVPFVQFKKREKNPWRSVTFKSNTPPWMFFTFIAQRIRYVCFNAFISCFNHLPGAQFNYCTVCLIHFQ